MFNSAPSLVKSTSLIIFIFLIISGLYFASQFLIPIAISILLSMLLIPLSNYFEKKGLNRIWASLICIILMISLFGGIIYLVSLQAAGISDNLREIFLRIQQMIIEVQKFLAETVGISTQIQKIWIDKQTNNGTNDAIILAGSFLSYLMGIMIKSILVIVYTFLLLTSRSHLKQFILMLVPKEEVKETERLISDASKVSQNYLSGLGIMVVILWIMYGIGFSIIGVESAIFFAVLCGILEIVPFIGNLTGTGLTILMVISQGGSNSMVLGVFLTYMFIQFVQTYFLEPLVVGAEVNINPLFTILVLVFMEIIWGVPGMIMAIPMLGIVKIICDHVKPLKPYAFLIGKHKKS
jgi:predicted PurR-regulated permease PerM